MALPRLLKQHRSQRSWHESRERLVEWFDTPLGQRVLAEQQDIVDQVLPRCFGQQVLLSGVMADRLTLDSCVIPQRAILTTTEEQNQRCSAVLGLSPVQGELTSLPFETNSIDVLLLHHSLDVGHNVYAVLRELARVTVPGGTMIIIGFNPWSLWGAMRIFNKLLHRLVPWSCRFVSQYSLSDWLKLLDFDVEGCEYAFFLPPVNNSFLLRSLSAWRLPFGHKMSVLGATYLLVVKKKQTLMTPIKPTWRRPSLIPVPIQRSI